MMIFAFVLGCPPTENDDDPIEWIGGDAVEGLDLSADGEWVRTAIHMDGVYQSTAHDLVLSNTGSWCDDVYDVYFAEKFGDLPFADLQEQAQALWDEGDHGAACEAWRDFYAAYAEFTASSWYDGAAYLSIYVGDDDGLGAAPIEHSYPAGRDSDENFAFYGSLALHTGNYWAHVAESLDCEAAAVDGDMWPEDFEELLPLESDLVAGTLDLTAVDADTWSFTIDAELEADSDPEAREGTVEGAGTFTACDIEVYYEWKGGY